MPTHPVTDIHDTEQEAQKMIQDAKKKGRQQIQSTREQEEKKLNDALEKEKETGKEAIKKAKEEAGQICKEKMATGEKDIQSTLNNAEQRGEQATRTAIKAFADYVGLNL